MPQFFRLALGALIALSLAAGLVLGCSGDDQQQQPQQQEQDQQQQTAAAAEQAQQQQSESAAPSRAAAEQQEQQAQAQAQQQQQAQPQAVVGEVLNIVVSTQIIADWVRQVGGDQVNVYALVPSGADVHLLELSVADIRAVADADLVIINGAGLESAYEDALHENAKQILNLAEAIEAAGSELAPFMEPGTGHEDEHAAVETVGRLLVADAVEAHLSVIDLATDDVDSGLFEIAAADATVYSSPTHRYGIVLARGPEDGDDRIHVFDGGIYLVEHDDHHDLVSEPVSRHSLVLAEEMPVHYVNSHGWTSIFADTDGHVILINEEELTHSQGDYEPLVLEAGPQHGAALVIADGHIAVTVPHPDYLENPNFWNILPEGVEVRTFDNELVFDAGACHRTHGEAHNEHGVVFGCWTGTLFLHAHDGEYESELIPYPAEAGPEGEFAIGQYYGHHHADNFFGQSTLFPGGECCVQGGVWLVNVAHGEMHEVFPEPSVSGAFSSDGETFYMLAADGILRAFDAHDGDLIDSMQLVDPFELVFGTPTPAILVVGDMLYVADPNSGHVLGVHLAHMEIEEEWHLDGVPSSLAFVGITDSGGAPDAGHDEDEMHDEDEHGHEEEEHEEGEEHEEDEHEEDEHGHDDEEEGHEMEGDDHGHHHGSEDPHFWFDADLASVAITAIAQELSHLNPDAADIFSDRLELYLAAVSEADAEARALIESVPEDQRVLVTFHDAFAYFARRYGLEIVGFLIHGPEQGISAQTIAELVELIEHEGVATVFHEPQFDSSALDAVAEETGTRRGIIWSQPTPDNPTYIGILVGNARAIAEQ